VSDRPRVDLTQALKSPMRVRILELFTRETDRPMEADSLLEALTTFFPDARRKQVSYHLTILREARLVPAA
jgi:DNA-binding transcriptional ArsR family regulator